MSIDGGAIDTDHKFLIYLINEFDALFGSGFDQFRILDALKRLEYYTAYHFAREEAIQQAIAFPRRKEHEEQHRGLRLKVKEVMSLLAHDIPRDGQPGVQKRILDLLRVWIVGHICKYDREMIPCIRKRVAALSVRPKKPINDGVDQGWSIPFYETGNAMAVQVVETDRFVGISFRGRATIDDSHIAAKACELVNALTFSSIVVNVTDVRDFDDYFIGHILILLGTFKEGGRDTSMVIGSRGPCFEKLMRLGVDKVQRCFPSTSEFYEEVGFHTE